MNILLVEDEQHKIDDLSKRLRLACLPSYDLQIVQSVKDAVLAVSVLDYHLVVLDMALPTFTKDRGDGESGGVAQASGGVEVLRAMQLASRRGKIIVVTQYPDITISGVRVKYRKMGAILRKRYEQNVVGVVLYLYNDEKWAESFDSFLGKLR